MFYKYYTSMSVKSSGVVLISDRKFENYFCWTETLVGVGSLHPTAGYATRCSLTMRTCTIAHNKQHTDVVYSTLYDDALIVVIIKKDLVYKY